MALKKKGGAIFWDREGFDSTFVTIVKLKISQKRSIKVYSGEKIQLAKTEKLLFLNEIP